jgi:Siphovirus ReqiPepy6 Gp37-like protein
VDLYTLTRGFLPNVVIDKFDSAIWTDRYYGDSDVQLIVPATPDMIQVLAPGTFLACDYSNEVMMLETHEIDKGALKVTGVSLLQWLNNRFVRTTAKHEDKYWNLNSWTAGVTMWVIVYYMCIVPGYFPNGVVDNSSLIIPGLKLDNYDNSGPIITVAVPFGPVYDALKAIATTYQIGMTITLMSATDTSFALGFRTYKGLDRTSQQTLNPPVRFSPAMDSLTNIKELQSMANFKTRVYSWAPANPGGLASTPGFSSIMNPGTPSTGFDLRTMMVFADDITTDQVGGSASVLQSLLDQRASETRQDHKFIKHVDGEIVPTSQFAYGVDYNLGDIIEVQGYSGITQNARVTEYIHSQDSAGEKAYPTVTMID